MKCQKLFEIIDSLEAEYISVWEDVCNIESPTNDKSGVDEVGKYFSRLAEKKGWDVEIFPVEKSGDIVTIVMNKDAKGAPIALSGHIDTVHPKGLFGYPPVKIVTEEGKIYGPGVDDCKGGVVAGFLAMDALAKVGFTERPVMMILQTDEECGSEQSGRATIDHICERAQGAEAFLNLEPYSKGKVCLARKGILNLIIRTFGKEAHSSSCAREGANAILEAAHKIIELEKLKDNTGITCNCGVISGGTVANTVPDRCEFTANIRFSDEKQCEEAMAYVKKVAETVYVEGCSCEVEIEHVRVAMEYTEMNLSLFDSMNRIFEENGLPTHVAVKTNGGSDAADVTAYGIPCVDSIGVRGGKIHSKDEFAYLDSLNESAKMIAATVYCI